MTKEIVFLVCADLVITIPGPQHCHPAPPEYPAERPFIVIAAPPAPGITLTRYDDYSLVTSSKALKVD